MNSSRANTRSEENPTLYGMALNSVYNPSSVYCTGFRNGKQLSPCSVVPSECPGHPVPQSPLPTIPNRRFDFPMSCYRKHLWQYHGYEEERNTQGTPTELQPSRISQSSCGRRGVLSDPREGEDPAPDKMCDKEVGGRGSCSQGSVPSTAQLAQSNKVNEVTQCDVSSEDADLEISPETSPEGGKGTGEESVLGRDLNGQKVGKRGRYNKIDKAIQCDMSLEDADLENSFESSPEGGKGTEEESVLGRDLDGEKVGERDSYNRIEATQCDVSLEDADLERSPESSPEGGKGTGEESVLGRDLDGEKVGERDSYNRIEATQCDVSLEGADLERSPESSPEGGKGTGEESVLGRDLDGEKVGERDSYNRIEATQCDVSLEGADLERSPESSPEGGKGTGEESVLGRDLDGEKVGERDSYNRIEATQCDVSLEGADLKISPESSPEGGKGTGEESVLGRDLDGEKVGERDSYNRIEATQCDVSLEGADLERSPESSPEGGKGTGEESVLGRDLDGEKVGERDSYNRIEATQCDVSLEDADLERSPESSPEGGKGTGEESALGRDLDGEEVGERDSYNRIEATQCDVSLEGADLERSPESSPEGGKGTGEESALGRDLDGEEVGERDSYNRIEATQCDVSLEDADLEISPEQMGYLNRDASWDIVLLNDCELEDEASGVEWVSEEVSGLSSQEASGPSFIERFYNEACRATRLLASSFYPQFIWPSSNKTDDNKYAADENIPPVSMLARKQDSEINCSKFETEGMTAQEGLEPMTSSLESLEWNETHY